MKRHLGLILICACSVLAVGCEPLPEDDEVSVMTPQSDIDIPLHVSKSSDYNKYSQELKVQSPFDPKDVPTDVTAQEPASNNQMHVAGTQRPPKHAN